MFWRKQAEISRLRVINDKLRADVKHHLDRQIELARDVDRSDADTLKLTRDLREMDQLVYQMSQSGNAEQLRSAVARAWIITEKRMQAESKRIQAVLIPEIKAAYANHETELTAPSEHHRRLTKG